MQDLFEGQVPLLRPWLGEEEVEAIADVVRSGWISQGPRVAEFEQAVAGYLGAAHGVATNACTTSIHLALILSGVQPGDEVIVPSFTCMATANAIHHAGAVPVFGEIDARTYNLDPDRIEEVLTSKTRGIVVVHQIGLPADMDSFRSVAEKHDLVLIEDGATTFGGTYKGKRVGSLGSPTCFSFHPRKMITTGEGGMIVTDDAELAEKARQLRATGASISDLDRHKAKGVLVQEYFSVGYNYRMTDMQAAVGLVQMKKIGAMLEQRTAQARRYDEALASVEEADAPFVPDYATHAYSSYMIRLSPASPVDQRTLLQRMADMGVSCRVGIQPLHHEPFYQNIYPGLKLPVTEDAARTTLFLPIFPGMREDEQERVIHALKSSLAQRA